MKVETRSALPTLLRTLTDAELHELLVTVQTELLNRPAQGTGLAVEVVTEEDAEVLALYRRLPPGQCEGLQTVYYIRKGAVQQTTELPTILIELRPTCAGRP